jgi:hypothetical protein
MFFERVFRLATTVKSHNLHTAKFAILDTEWPSAKAVFETWLAPDNFDEAGNQKLRLGNPTSDLLQDSRPQATVRLSEQN